jgi:MFS family permease
MGKVGAAVGMGFIVGPLLGGLTATAGTAMVGWVAAGITGLNLLVAIRILPESVRRDHVEPLPPVVVSPMRLAVPLAVLFLATLAFSVMYVVFPLWGEQSLGASRSTVGYWFALIGLVTAIVQGGVLGRTVTWLGEHGSARLGTALLAVGLLSVPFAGQAGGLPLYLVLAVLGAGYGLAGPAMLGLVSRLTGAARQGRILGVAQSAASLARIIGPIIAGVVMGAAGAGAAFGVSAAVAATGMLVALLIGARQLSPAR